jgi:hypothetical protein
MMNIRLVCIMALALGSVALAEPQEGNPGGESRAKFDAIRKVSTLLDTDVMNRANEEIADLEDLVLTPEGRVQYAILGYGGLAGVGASYTAVPWGALDVKFVEGKWAVNLDMTKEALAKAPKFQGENYQDLTNAEWVNRVHAFFRPRTEEASQPRRALESILRATKIVDATLKNARDESIGEVEELLLDREGRVAFAILGRGGVLDIGESFIPVPWSNLRLNYSKEDTSVTAVIDITKERLEKAPLVKGDSYANLLDPKFREYVYKYFGATQSGRSAGAVGNETPGTDRP